MKTNKFNLQQMKGYYHGFTYKVKSQKIRKNGWHEFLVDFYNSNGFYISELIFCVETKRKYKKIFHKIIKSFTEEMEMHITHLIYENYTNDTDFTRSATVTYYK
jgi:hypothetical protein